MSINDDVYSRMLKHRALLTLYEKRLDTEIDKILASHKIRLQRIVALSGSTNINALTRKLNTEIRLTYKKIYEYDKRKFYIYFLTISIIYLA